ncbi:MAG: hypothetical protein M3Q08_06650 [Pseudomonadota bacterium]|nr:hypothetical protein [Pseudomonadota bacterium]
MHEPIQNHFALEHRADGSFAAPEVRRGPGRPTTFTQELADRICEQLMEGNSLRTICRDKAMPNRKTVFRWLAGNEVFRVQYAQARELQADTLFEDTLDIADDASNDWTLEKEDEDGFRYNGDHVQRARLRIETRKWIASKLAPKKYGDASKVALTGGDEGDLPARIVFEVVKRGESLGS